MAPNEAGPAVRLLAGVLAISMLALLGYSLLGHISAMKFQWSDAPFHLGLLLFGAVSGIVAIRGFVPPSLLWLIPRFRSATGGKNLREK